MADIISKFPNLCNLPEQTAVLYCMFINMRWHINPSKENFERLSHMSQTSNVKLRDVAQNVVDMANDRFAPRD